MIKTLNITRFSWIFLQKIFNAITSISMIIDNRMIIQLIIPTENYIKHIHYYTYTHSFI